MPNIPEMGRFWSSMASALENITNGRQPPKEALDAAAARMLGVKRTTLASKLRRRGDLDPEGDEPEDDEGDLGGGDPGAGRGRPTLQ